ncbi:MAG: nicotinamide mononucleotide deamidase-related protein [Desulfurococcales archaeon]|nr:nicotinamide mononucleotide deamidase-related protein [Desulfurococcales archaeon]
MPPGEFDSWILTIGNEILIGRIVNTNASWLASRLTLLGFRVARIITVPDDVADIAEEVGRAVARARVVVTTGGLGPTYDDVTLEGVARALGRRLTVNDRALDMVRRFYEARGLELTEERVKMAMLPEGAEAIPNPVGAAPGSIIDHGGALVISLPGVPSEMKEMFTRYVEPRLREIAPNVALVECYARVIGVPESGLAPVVKRAARSREGVYLKTHPKGHELEGPVIEVRALASAGSVEEARAKALEVVREVVSYAREQGGRVGEEGCTG